MYVRWGNLSLQWFCIHEPHLDREASYQLQKTSGRSTQHKRLQRWRCCDRSKGSRGMWFMLDFCHCCLCLIMAHYRRAVRWWHRPLRAVPSPMHSIQWLWWRFHLIRYECDSINWVTSIRNLPVLARHRLYWYLRIPRSTSSNIQHRLLWC